MGELGHISVRFIFINHFYNEQRLSIDYHFSIIFHWVLLHFLKLFLITLSKSSVFFIYTDYLIVVFQKNCQQALTTGSVPNFIDVIMNFKSSELKEDNIIYQAVQKKKRVIFYGDDTWLKLFPNLFTRSEGTTSFFVSDYSEVSKLCIIQSK